MIKPDPSSRHPLVVFLLALCAVSGVGILAAEAPAPNSIEAAMPHWQVLVWAWALAVGGVVTLLGIWLQGRDHRLRDGVLAEQYGMILLAPSALIYGVAAFSYAGVSGLLPSGVVVAMGVACAYRWFTLQRDVKKSRIAQAALGLKP